MSIPGDLLDTYEKIISQKVSDRNSGLAELKQLLSTDELTRLNDKGFHKMYEALFRAIMVDKSLYVRQNSTSRNANTIASRMSAAGSVFRMAVDKGAALIKPRTLRAVINHIMDVLPMADNKLCESISTDYLKALHSCLKHQNNLEYVALEEWKQLVKFCCHHINNMLGLENRNEDDLEEQSREEPNRPLSRMLRLPILEAGFRTGSKLTPESEALFECLRCLVTVPSAPIQQHARGICDTLLGFLCSYNMTRVHQAIFTTLNHVFVSITVNNLELTYTISEKIVPVVARLWDTKAHEVKEEMTVSLIYCLPHIRSKLLESGVVPEAIREAIENLKDILVANYLPIELDDVDFPHPQMVLDGGIDDLTLRTIALRQSLSDFRMEQTWATTRLISAAIEILDRVGRAGTYSRNEDNTTHKRHKKLNSHFDEMMRHLRSSITPSKLLALQVLPFLSDFGGISEEDFGSTILSIYDACSDDNHTVSSWALLSIGSCAFLKSASDPVHAHIWQKVWKLCARYATNHSTCRAACHVMRIILSHGLIPYSNISKDVDTVIGSLDLNGPAILTDSSLALWEVVLEKRKTVAQSLLSHPEEKLFLWFMDKWKPVAILEKCVTPYYIRNKYWHLPAVYIIQFLYACIGVKSLDFKTVSQRVCGSIGRAYLRNHQYSQLHDILLDSVDGGRKDEEKKSFGDEGSDGYVNHNYDLEVIIIEFLESQLQKVDQKWKDMTQSSVQHITENTMRNFVDFILIVSIVCSSVTTIEAQERSKKLKQNLIPTLIEGLESYISRGNFKQKPEDGLLLAISDFLPRASEIVKITNPNPFNKILREVTVTFFSRIHNAFTKTDTPVSSNTMSQLSDPGDIVTEVFNDAHLLHRELLQAQCSIEGFRSSTKALIALCVCAVKPGLVCSEFTDYLKIIKKSQLVLARPIVQDFMVSVSDQWNSQELIYFCEFITHTILEDEEYARCETSLVLCLDLINSLAHRWVPAAYDGFIDLFFCIQVYEHAIKISLGELGVQRKATTPRIRMEMARLLDRVIGINAKYVPPNQSVKVSALVLYLELLGDLDVRVSHFVSRTLPALFSKNEVGLHAALFLNVEDRLPQRSGWIEGLALRVNSLAKLAPVVSASISRLVFRIFETALVDKAERFARRALISVAKALGLASQRELFVLFAPKLIFTWTQNSEFQAFPFKVLGYNSMKEMCECSQVRDEVVAQLLAKGNGNDVEYVARVLNITTIELLTKTFPKVIAYGLAWATGQRPEDKDNDEASTSKRTNVGVYVRRKLGEAKYVELASRHFRTIISNLFHLMLEEGTSEKLLSRDPSLADAYQVMKDITEQGCSKKKLADLALRPYFRVRAILGAVHHFWCNEAKLEESKLWSLQMVAFIAREMLDTLHPALGSTHASSIIRNLRLLICLAGPIVLEGYILEMIIHALKPYAVDFYCSEDTIGILRYLISNGRSHFLRKPTFILGFFLSLLTSIRHCSKQSLDKLQVQRLSCQDIEAIKSFNDWVAGQLSSLKSKDLTKVQNATFQSIVSAAVCFKGNVSVLENTTEAELLKHILDDDASQYKILDETSRRSAFALCCSDFIRPESFQDDIFSDDEASFERSKSLLSICRRFPVSKGFLLYSGRVLGRSYASTGQLHSEWMSELELDLHMQLNNPEIDFAPKHGILKILRELLLSEDGSVVRLIERTLEKLLHQDLNLSQHHVWRAVFDDEEFKCWISPSGTDLSFEEISPISILEIESPDILSVEIWLKKLTIAICSNLKQVPIAHMLIPVIEKLPGLAAGLFHHVIHLLLIQSASNKDSYKNRDDLSQIFHKCLSSCTQDTVSHNTALLKCILYLRTQRTRGERGPSDPSPEKYKSKHYDTMSVRDEWLQIEYLDAARAACKCRMFKTALLFFEIHGSRTLTNDDSAKSQLLLEIYQNIDDPDSYYGVKQEPSLETVLHRFEHEGDGWKSLAFRGAMIESLIRQNEGVRKQKLGIADDLNTLGMNGLSQSFLNSNEDMFATDEITEKSFKSARKLQQWDIPCPPSKWESTSAGLYRALQSLNNELDCRPATLHVDPPILNIMNQLTTGIQTGHSLARGMRALAMLTETEEVLSSQSSTKVFEVFANFEKRKEWMLTGKYSDVEEIMSMRQATFGSLSKKPHLQAKLGLRPPMAMLLEIKTTVGQCKMARIHGVRQHALSAGMHLSNIVVPCKEKGLVIDSVAAYQVAQILWDDGQGIESIRMLQSLMEKKPSSEETLPVVRSKILAKLGTWISEARLERPDRIMSNYLERAITELANEGHTASDAGRVYHAMATFCDQQLNNPGNIEDFERAQKLRKDKEQEVRDSEDLLTKHPKSKSIQQTLNRAKTWLQIDNADFKKMENIRQEFLEKSILNFLRCLEVCDDFDDDAVRFCGLWLAHNKNTMANKVVESKIKAIPSRKFIPLMNQLSSRLQWTKDEFQILLTFVVTRMCEDHPYHSIYQILALTKMNVTQGDDTSSKRKDGAKAVASKIIVNPRSGKAYNAILDSANTFIALANAKPSPEDLKAKIVVLKKLVARGCLERITSSRVPPPTMHIDVRADCDYSSVPHIIKFDSVATIASGLSQPKIFKCQASDGQTFKSLVKGGNDDLRQDAIMEQVFVQVNYLLQKKSGQRNLKIRTYSVIPLASTGGIIEFVANTIPLHDYIIPAHSQYRSQDLKHTQCRSAISAVQDKTKEVRISAFQKVCRQFQPVLRYFFMHQFNGPDAWYAARMAYTRSTAVMSIVGYMVGLGDRHGHNILLDNKTGEVIHIDLGVAFEQGRILPVPEIVPFRLTRDVVDGMGSLKTEGVFRRICEHTLEVLRNESHSIMTILDVLRYDPLYSWTASPLRMKKIYEREQDKRLKDEVKTTGNLKTIHIDGEDPEAERALTVMSKKLSKNLSVSATVNELIQQASDERNLALLYVGWSAYA